MSDQATLAPLVADDGEAEIRPPAETIPLESRTSRGEAEHAASTASETAAAEPPPGKPTEGGQEFAVAPVAAPRQRSRWFPALCALVALIAAIATLAAPTLRPAIVRVANAWLGEQNPVTRLLAPPSDLEQRIAAARQEAMQALTGRLAEYDARIDRLAAAQQATNADVSRALAQFGSDHTASETLARTVDRLSQQTAELGSAVASLDGRVRAAGLLSLSLRLRRDLDAGLPISRDLAALAATGPYPPAVERAMAELRRIADGVPTMRDLADEFDGVVARFRAQAASEGTWTSRGWSRLTTLFSGGAPNSSAGFIEHLRALAADGRFSEVADEIAASDYVDLGGEWVARVRARATAVVATQAVLGYALAAQENAYAAQPGGTGGKLTQ